MHKFVYLGALSLMLSAGFARADGSDHEPCRDNHCKQPTKDVCFNLMCYYESEGEGHEHGGHEHEGHEHSYTAAATFQKDVTLDGGEVVDDSKQGDSPKFEVSADGKPIFENSSRRFTSLLGTRIQGEEGPNPAILLPRGALHGGVFEGGGHYSESILELAGDEGFKRFKGQCFIWTGRP